MYGFHALTAENSASEAAVDFEPLIEKAIADTEMVIASNERVKAEGKA